MQLGLNHESQDTTKYILSKMNPNKKKQKNKKRKHIYPENDHSRPNNCCLLYTSPSPRDA